MWPTRLNDARIYVVSCMWILIMVRYQVLTATKRMIIALIIEAEIKLYNLYATTQKTVTIDYNIHL